MATFEVMVMKCRCDTVSTNGSPGNQGCRTFAPRAALFCGMSHLLCLLTTHLLTQHTTHLLTQSPYQRRRSTPGKEKKAVRELGWGGVDREEVLAEVSKRPEWAGFTRQTEAEGAGRAKVPEQNPRAGSRRGS